MSARPRYSVAAMLDRLWGVMRCRVEPLGAHEWRARCPRHPGTGFSISIIPPSLRDDRMWWFSCDCGCSLHEVAQLLNLPIVESHDGPTAGGRAA